METTLLGRRVAGVRQLRPGLVPSRPLNRGFPKSRGTIWGSHKKDYNILGSILGPPISGNYGIKQGYTGISVSLRKNLDSSTSIATSPHLVRYT